MNKINIADEFIKKNISNVNSYYRHSYHLMPPVGWMNDPNGFSRFNNKYQLFYQYNPYSTIQKAIHWGHCESEDLIKWKLLPVALAPDQDYDAGGVFSGSAIAVGEKLYLMYTGHLDPEPSDPNQIRQVQAIAYSTDGITFVKSTKNPVIDTDSIPDNGSKQDFRDPKVFEKNGVYYCLVASLNENETGQILIYKSNNLEDWTFLNTCYESNGVCGIMWECPDLVSFGEKDIIIVSPQWTKNQGHSYKNDFSVIYMNGKMSLETGEFEYSSHHLLDYGFDYYAPQTIKHEDGRIILIAWMNVWERSYPTHELGHDWVGSMTIPRELTLVNDELYQYPITELENYRRNHINYQDVEITELTSFDKVNGQVLDLDITLEVLNSKEITIDLFKSKHEKMTLKIDVIESTISLDKRYSGLAVRGIDLYHDPIRTADLKIENGMVNLRILLDRSSIEIFINKGKRTMTSTVYPDIRSNRIEFDSVGLMRIKSISKWDIVV